MHVSLQEQRLRDRQTETEETLQKRLEAARIDMELSKSQMIPLVHYYTRSDINALILTR